MAASSNTLTVDASRIAKIGLVHLKNNLVFGNRVNRTYQNMFGVKEGSTFVIRDPNMYTVSTGRDLEKQNQAESTQSFTVATQKHIDMAWSTLELTQSIEELEERYIKPAMIKLANEVDVALAALYKDVSDQVGTAGTNPATFSVFGDCNERLDENACPNDPRTMALNPKAFWSMADNLKGTFDKGLAHDTIRKGSLGQIAGMEFMKGQNIQRHTTGAFTTSATPLMKGATQTGAAIATDGWNGNSSTVKDGDIFTIAGVNAVNPISKADLGYLKQFVVTADTTSVSNEMLTLPISPSIVTTGAYQNVSAATGDDAALTFVGTESTAYPVHLGFHRDAFSLVVLPLAMPDSISWKSRQTMDNISIRVIKVYDYEFDDEILRFDILYGLKTIRPEFACRIIGG
jgi:hypothetical protein